MAAASSFSEKVPPAFDKQKDSYEKWKKRFKLWQTVTNVPKEKQGSYLVLRLDDDTQENILENVDEDELNSESGVETVIQHLDSLLLKDKTVSAFEIIEEFESFKRKPNQSMSDFCNEFHKKLSKTRAYGEDMFDSILAYRLFKAANLSEEKENLVRATITEVTYDNMSEQLKKIFSSTVANSDHAEQEDTFYFNNMKNRRPYYQNKYKQSGSSSYNRGKKGKNPLDKSGNITRCAICESVNHWANQCPDRKKTHNTYHQENSDQEESDNDFESYHTQADYDIELYQTDEVNPTKLSTLLQESLGACVLDSGATKTVCGHLWFTCYLDMLSEKQKSQIVYLSSDSCFKFGDGARVRSKKKVKIPATIGNSSVTIESDVIDSNIPLLLSKNYLKKAKANLDFVTDSLDILGQKIPLKVSTSGHYLLPLNNRKQIIVDSDRNKRPNITLFTKNYTAKEVATKLHKQFAHPPALKLINLVKTQPGNQENVIKEIKKVSKKCKICQEFKRVPPRPVVSLPLATKFGECVAMDLKQFGKVHLLHMIDVATRFSAGAVITNKQPETIIKQIFCHWISIFGTPEKFLSDNGGEFNNPALRELCEKCNLIVLTTAAESPWSNGLVECHNRVLGEMISKTMADSKCSLEMAVMWCLAAHNSLRNMHGFSPFQLVFSRNPTIPVLLDAKPPALSSESSSDILRKNLNALHKAREAFISSENSERLKRALKHNIRTSGGTRYYTNDKVYYKRMDSKCWKGPATVLGQDGKQVLIKHGGSYVRVHPCRVSLVKQTSYSKQKKDSETNSIHSNLDDDSEKSEDSESENSERNLDNSDNDTSEDEDSSNNDQNANQNSSEEDRENPDSNDESSNSTENDSENPDSSDENSNMKINEGSEHNVNNVNQKQPRTVGRPRKYDLEKPSTKKKLKQGMTVKVKFKNKDNWDKVKLISRSGKTGGKYGNEWNTIMNNTKPKVVDFDRDINEYNSDIFHTSEENINCSVALKNSENDINIAEEVCTEIFLSNNDDKVLEAKLDELKSWKKNKVYKEVENKGQSTISIKWVLREKKLQDKVFIKARLVLRGYEELKTFRTDSPTCRRESVRIMLTILSSKGWKLQSIDFKTAYLQGQPIEREIFIVPPKEADTSQLWQLKKTVYGLSDAPRQWYLSLSKVLIGLGCNHHSIDHGLFYYHLDDHLIGILLTYVDDLLWGGDENFNLTVMTELRKQFLISHEEETVFTYVGIQLKQYSDFSISINQSNYIDTLNPITLSDDRLSDKESSLTTAELKLLRSTVGQLGWVASITRPDISFLFGSASSNITRATVQDILNVNKIIRHVKYTKSRIFFAKMSSNMNELSIIMYSDASYKNLPDSGSQGGHIVFLSDGRNCSPLAWHSTRVKRIVRSSTASELLALLDGCDTAFLMSRLISEIYSGRRGVSIPIECYTDSKNLFDAAHSTTSISDQKALVDLSIVREQIKNKEIQLKWISNKQQLADVLTKKGANCDGLLNVLSKGKF